MAKEKTRWLPLTAGTGLAIAAVVLLGLVIFGDELFPEYSPAHRGARVAQEAGCFACHGGFDGRAAPNPARDGGSPVPVPSILSSRRPLDEIRQWIEDGISKEKRASEAHLKERERRILEMPAYRDRLSPGDIDDLIAFVALAQYGHAASRGGSASEGERLARKWACFTCHGELGQGGVDNPGSLKGYIPGFFGTDFRALTRNGNREDIREWIRDGISSHIWNQGFAGVYPGRYFTGRQVIRMPAYGDSLSDAEVEALTDHLLELMELGPLDASGMLEFRPLNPGVPGALPAESGESGEDSNAAKSLERELDALVPQALHYLSVPGAAVAVLRDGRVVYARGFGWADRSLRRRVGAETGFSVGSISKTVAAWAVMRLVETGRLDLDSPVDAYVTRWSLPPSSHNLRDVTIRRLLSHTAGLSLHGYPGWPPNQPLPSLEESLSGMTNGAGDVRLILPPGREWRYSGGGYTLLQMALEEVSGEDFAEFARREVLAPLGMANSGFADPLETADGPSRAHDQFGNRIPSHRFAELAAAGLHTTIRDLALFAAASLRGPDGSPPGRGVLRPETVRLMMEAAPATEGGYGLGYSISRREKGPPLRGHTGANIGWHAVLQIIPESGDGLVVMTNGENGWALYTLLLGRWLETLAEEDSAERTVRG